MAVIVILRFVIAPFVWGPQIASDLGSALGYLFYLWLVVVAVVATLWKICHEKPKDKREAE